MKSSKHIHFSQKVRFFRLHLPKTGSKITEEPQPDFTIQEKEMPGINDYVQMEISGTYREEHSPLEQYQPFFINIQQVFPIRNAPYHVHASADYEMILPMKNEYRCLINEESLVVHPGEFVIIQAHQRHQDLFDRESPYQTFHFLIRKQSSNEQLTTLFAPNLPCRQQVAKLPERSFVETIIQLIWEEAHRHPGPENCHIQNSLFQALFWKCIPMFPQENLYADFIRHAMNRNIVSQLFRIFEQNLTKMPTLETLCLESGMSRSSLNRVCNRLFGLPPLKAFMKFKIDRARQIMSIHPEMKVKEISDYLHFENPFHFSRIFKKYALYPPSRHSELNRK